MFGLGTPRVPALPLLALSAGWSAGVHVCIFALLPCFADPTAPATSVAIALAAFHVPALLLHPMLRKLPPRRPERALALALGFDVIATLLIARAAALPKEVHFGDHAWQFPSLLAAAMLIAGVAAVLTHSQTLLHVSSFMPPLTFHWDLGIHLSVIEGTAAFFGAAVPPAAALLLVYSNAPSYLPFVMLALAQLVLLPFSTAALLRRKSTSADLEHLTNEIQPVITPPAFQLSEEASGAVGVVRLSSTWAPMLAMLTAVACTAALRPVLTAHLVVDEHRSVLVAAVLFSVMSACAILADTIVTALNVIRTLRLAVILVGMTLVSFGFHLLKNPDHLFLAVVIVSVGANGALVLTLGHFAEQCDIQLSGQHDLVTFIAFMVFSFGEGAGMLVSGILKDWTGSFQASMAVLSKLVIAVVCLLLLERFLCMAWSFLSLSSSRHDRSVGLTLSEEAEPLLSSMQGMK